MRAPADEGAAASNREGVPSPASLIGTGEIYIARDGTWYHEGRPFKRTDLARLFSTILRREADGTYWLKTPVETVRVHVEDAPFVVQELQREDREGTQVLSFRTNFGDWVEAGPDHPLRIEVDAETGEPGPYLRVKDGLDALLARSVFYQLVELAEPATDAAGNEVYGVWSHGVFYQLGTA
ncbi:hypothetical protein SAMN05216241_101191 [Limimonas halophila]|uniref:DUF1285 domain-containing protein n=1 Tax=Limimonas halophila TaxID=1082479 RepID=A0A1G7LC47_9PROT|nr:DUF1285 domain-containing protein [Limimonas halophila]SDF46874.1 hypothetical protein SAMN05216241_101191 [Limimonas halophila]